MSFSELSAIIFFYSKEKQHVPPPWSLRHSGWQDGTDKCSSPLSEKFLCRLHCKLEEEKKKGGFASLSPVLITSSPGKSALVSDTAGAVTAGNTLAERKALQVWCPPASWCCTSSTRRISCCWRAWWLAVWLGTARRAGRMVTNISRCLFLALKMPLFFRGLEVWLWIKNQRSTWCS